jgi:hypothetical protein
MKSFSQVRESTSEYGKSLRKIANDNKLKSISKKDKETLSKIADMLAKANEDFKTEALSDADKKKRLAMIKKAVEKISKSNADKAKKDALRMMKDSGMFDEDVNEDGPCWDGYKQVGTKMKNGKEVPNCVPIKESKVEESALVMADMDIVDTILKKIKDDIFSDRAKKRFEKSWPKVQALAKMAGYGITKSNQTKGKTFRYDLKK